MVRAVVQAGAPSPMETAHGSCAPNSGHGWVLRPKGGLHPRFPGHHPEPNGDGLSVKVWYRFRSPCVNNGLDVGRRTEGQADGHGTYGTRSNSLLYVFPYSTLPPRKKIRPDFGRSGEPWKEASRRWAAWSKCPAILCRVHILCCTHLIVHEHVHAGSTNPRLIPQTGQATGPESRPYPERRVIDRQLSRQAPRCDAGQGSCSNKSGTPMGREEGWPWQPCLARVKSNCCLRKRQWFVGLGSTHEKSILYDLPDRLTD